MSLTRRKILKATAAATVTSLTGVEALSSLGSKSAPVLETALVSNTAFVVQPLYKHISQLPITDYLHLVFEESAKNELNS